MLTKVTVPVSSELPNSTSGRDNSQQPVQEKKQQLTCTSITAGVFAGAVSTVVAYPITRSILPILALPYSAAIIKSPFLQFCIKAMLIGVPILLGIKFGHSIAIGLSMLTEP